MGDKVEDLRLMKKIFSEEFSHQQLIIEEECKTAHLHKELLDSYRELWIHAIRLSRKLDGEQQDRDYIENNKVLDRLYQQLLTMRASLVEQKH